MTKYKFVAEVETFYDLIIFKMKIPKLLPPQYICKTCAEGFKTTNYNTFIAHRNDLHHGKADYVLRWTGKAHIFRVLIFLCSFIKICFDLYRPFVVDNKLLTPY